jgi:guanylate kinase
LEKKMKSKKHGLLIVLSSPSGGGKTTVAQRLLKRDKNLVRSVSCTTRKRRLGEKNGRDYFFVTRPQFKRMVSQRAFLEWAKVHDQYYGTPRLWVERQLKKGKDVLFVIDVQGGNAIRRRFKNAVLIFLKTPNFSVLKQRLLGRKSDDLETVKLRLKNALWELKAGRRYHYQVINDKLNQAVSKVAKLIRKERLGHSLK